MNECVEKPQSNLGNQIIELESQKRILELTREILELTREIEILSRNSSENVGNTFDCPDSTMAKSVDPYLGRTGETDVAQDMTTERSSIGEGPCPIFPPSPISIEALDYGYVVRVSNKRVAIETVDKLTSKLNACLNDPDAFVSNLENSMNDYSKSFNLTKGSLDTENKQNTKPREVNIELPNYGFIVRIGCQTVAIDDIDKLCSKLNEYLKNPGFFEQKWYVERQSKNMMKS